MNSVKIKDKRILREFERMIPALSSPLLEDIYFLVRTELQERDRKIIEETL